MRKLSPTQMRMLRRLDVEVISSMTIHWRTADVLVRRGFAKWNRSTDARLKNWLDLGITNEGRQHLRARAIVAAL